jgi:hypothetical protein
MFEFLGFIWNLIQVAFFIGVIILAIVLIYGIFEHFLGEERAKKRA